MNVGGFVRSFLLGSPSWEQFSILLARVSLGVFFAISGGRKLFVASRTRQMYETLAGAGIPFPHFMTYFVSSVGNPEQGERDSAMIPNGVPG